MIRMERSHFEYRNLIRKYFPLFSYPYYKICFIHSWRIIGIRELLQKKRDIHNLRPLVDRIVVNFHWGVPYERIPSVKDQEKARFAIDCGADVIIV